MTHTCQCGWQGEGPISTIRLTDVDEDDHSTVNRNGNRVNKENALFLEHGTSNPSAKLSGLRVE